MDKKLTQIGSRDVAPQWGGGKGNNLGSFKITPTEFTGAGVIALVTEGDVVECELYADAIADMMNGQMHIRFGSASCGDEVAKELPKKNKDEKTEAWLVRTFDAAKAVAARVLVSFSPNYVEMFKTWTKENFAKRAEKQDNRPTLPDFDLIVGFVREKWEGAEEAKRVANLAKLGLAAGLKDADAEAVVAAIEVKYKRPIAVSASELEF